MIENPLMQGLKKCLLAIIAVVPLFISTAYAAEYPAPVGYVNDFANVISAPVKTQLSNIITQFEKTSGNEIVVATIPSLQGEPVDNYAVNLFKKWGVGKKGQDNGLLLLIAPNDREIRIEVGYGLEPYINDALAGRIIRDTMIPHFRENDLSSGILNGVVEATSIIAKKTEIPFDAIAAGSISPDTEIYQVQNVNVKKTSLAEKIFKVVLIIIFIIFFIKNPWAALFIFSNLGRGGGSFRGGFGGGFSGFGGGMSGGGGASGRW